MSYIDARRNWWDKNLPDQNIIWGDNISIKPWLDKEESKAFREK
jgi:hypothetical protein